MHATSSRARAGWWIGPLLFLLALVLFSFTSARFTYPGESAVFVARHSGHAPYLSPTNGIWMWVSSVVASLPVGGLALRLNLFSAVWGAICVGLMYEVHRRTRQDRTGSKGPAEATLGTLTGVVAAMILGISIPFWQISTRAHPLGFDLTLLLSAILLLQVFDVSRKQRWLYASTFLYGVGTVEYSSFVVLLPAYAFYALASILSNGGEGRLGAVLSNVELIFGRQKKMREFPFLGSIGFFAFGFSTFFLLAYQFYQSPAAEWAELDSYAAALLQLLRQHYAQIMGSLPRVGWLLVGVTCVVPWVAVVALPQRNPIKRDAQLSVGGLNLVLLILAGALLANAPFAPWRVLGSGRAIVLPYVLVASWTACLVEFWYSFIFHRRSLTGERWPARRERTLKTVFLAAVLAAVTAAAWFNFPHADGRQGDFAREYANQIGDRVGDRSCIIGAGPVIHQLGPELFDRDLGVFLVDLAYMSSVPYQRYLADVLPEPELAALSEAGIVPVLSTWFAVDDAAVERIAVLSAADLLNLAGEVPLPEASFFVPETPETPDAAVLIADHREVWERAREALADAEEAADPWLAYPAVQFRNHVGKRANNLGVYLEDAGEDAGAMEAYSMARQIDSNNVSALLNLYVLTRRLESVEHEAIRAELEDFMQRLDSPSTVWSLGSAYGYVRDPGVLRDRGMSWALSGRPSRAIDQMERAADLGARGGAFRQALGELYLLEDRTEESAAQFRTILEHNPNHPGALIGMGRLTALAGDYDGAEQYLRRADEAGARPERLVVELASVKLLRGQSDEAAALLADAVEDNPENFHALILYAQVLHRLNRYDEARQLIEDVRLQDIQDAHLLAALSDVHRAMGNVKRLRACIAQGLSVAPTHAGLLERAIERHLADRDMAAAQERAKALLTINPSSPIANYVIALDQQLRGDLDMAASSYRRVLEQVRKPEALNNLAWLLVEEGELDEALQLAEECTSSIPDYTSGWDTLGVIYMKMGKLDEAMQAFTRVFERTPSHPATQIHMLELYLAKDMEQEARQLVDLLQASPEILTTDQRDALGELIQEMP